MKVLLKDLTGITERKAFEIDEEHLEVKDNIFLKGLKDVKGYIAFYYDLSEKLFIDYHLEGSMICPDAITLEDVEVPFTVGEDREVVTKENEEGFYLIDGMELNELVIYIVSPEAPISVEKKGETMYYSGDGWTIQSEEEYNKHSRERIDPRLEKLLEYKEEE